ncbi:hypothetical protein Klosneuvirus_3_133 [Klosneuvirus KNV1]|uniref:Uncharacterized protein n=1 Tax=Klosneuvirus KNV1 TaxID=1977640 RepID=A0A1V0SK57_9VIRU|nr:hypothetical protein Klosneuvirus_3_133 [Klosneuvirus KNV1]
MDTKQEKPVKEKYNYYKTHKDKFNIYTDCECGGKYSMNTKYNHFKTAKHKNAIKLLEQNKKIAELTHTINNMKEKKK